MTTTRRPPENEATQFTNVPSGDPLVIFPNNSDLPFSETERTRVNGQLTLQFRPVDNLTLTLDGLYARNEQQEQRSSQGNWFNRPFGQVGFADEQGRVVAVNFLQETLSAPKDIAWSQQWRETKDELQSVGFNAQWAVSDRFSLLFDVNTAEADSGPNGPGGMAAYDFGMGVAGIRAHSLDMRSGFPVQSFVYDDDTGGAYNAVLHVYKLRHVWCIAILAYSPVYTADIAYEFISYERDNPACERRLDRVSPVRDLRREAPH